LGNRKRLGILEKHKDYALRAKDFNEKKEKIKRLKQKAADKNKDEFYFGMVGKKTQVSRWHFQIHKKSALMPIQKGVHYQDRGNASLPIDLVKVLKTQDEGYLRNVRVTNLKVRVPAVFSLQN
jgi:U3 small nucleolar RNA-associated protein 11